MPHTHERIEFAPPDQGGNSRAISLALLAHVLLMGALTWGVNWKRSDSAPAFEAELWASTPQLAAPKQVLPPPAPPPPPPQPVQEVKPPPPAPVQRDADIAIEQEKKRREQEKKREEEKELLDKQKQTKLEQAKLEKDKLEKEKLEKEKQDKLNKEKLAAQEKKANELLEERKLEESRREQEQARREDDRKRNLERIAGLAGASGAPGAAGQATQAAGPSAGYGSRVRARVKPNIVFAQDLPGNPSAEVEVQTSPDGTITKIRVTKSSGSKEWDEAVVRALEKTELLPRDTDGRVPSPITIVFRSKEMLN